MSRSALERELKSNSLGTQDPTSVPLPVPLAAYDPGYNHLHLYISPVIPPVIDANINGSLSSSYPAYDVSSAMHQGVAYGYPSYHQYQPFPGAPPALPGYAPTAPVLFPVGSGSEVHALHGVDAGENAEGNSGESEEDRAKSVQFPIHGNSGHDFNINRLLFNNIMESDYFKALYQLRTYHETIDEIYNSVSHVGPWQTGTSRTPSTAFCLLVKFMLMRLTVKQLRGLLDTGDSPYVRSIGILFLRYCCAPKDLWSYYEPFLESEEEFAPSPDPNLKMTIGEFCIKLLTDMQYFGTTLPRIPIPIERKIKVMLLLLKEKQKRRVANSKMRDEGKFCKGATVQAIYGDAENEPAWYDAVIESKATAEQVLDHGKAVGTEASIDSSRFYWVTFPEYGNTELVDLGDMKLKGHESSNNNSHHSDRRRSRSRSRDRRRRSRSKDRGARSRSRDRRRRSRSGSTGRRSDDGARDFMAEVLKSERAASEAVGRNYAHRPASYKGSLSLKADRYTVRKKSRSRSPIRDRPSHSSRDTERRSRRSPSPPQAVTTASREQSRDHQEKMKRILDRYGDASAK